MRRGTWMAASVAAAAAAALALVFLLPRHAPHRRVLVLGLDGLDPRTVDLLMSEGKLPHFARLRQDGAYGRLQSMKPLLSPVVWTTVATGKTADEHGIGHFTAVDPATGQSLPVTSDMRKVKALWNIFSQAGRKVGVVGWWATWPAEHVNGFVVSDHTCYHFLFPEGERGGDTAALTFPEALQARIAPLIRRPSDVTAEEAAGFIHVTPAELQRPFSFDDDVSHFRWALATADSYRRIALDLWKTERPDLLMAYTEGTDSVSHLFGHLFRAQGLSGELAQQQAKFGGAVEAMYVWADGLLGSYLDAMDGDTTLVVLSDHGFDLGTIQDDPSKTRDMRRVSERYHNLYGLLYLYGAGVRRGAKLDDAKVLDVAPTLLALGGVPAAKDMPGRVLTEGLTIGDALPRVATYETGQAAKPMAADSKVDPAILERLRSLGYIDTASGSPAPGAPSPAASAGSVRSPTGERNIAAIEFERGRYKESEALYRKLVAEDPGNASLHASLAGVLGALERYEEATQQLDESIRLQPLNVEAYHNRGVVFERRGKRQEAIDSYRTALRYDAQYEPSRKAMVRLTGSADVGGPRTPEERQAAGLAQKAAELAKKGDYPGALKLLDQAEVAAPRYALVHQYRSNVAYLMGDRAGAIKALQKALKIEPDNALFKQNLDRLSAPPPPHRP